MRPIIVWYRRDLRLADHPALSAAVKSGAPVVPLYVLDEQTPGTWTAGGAGRWWLHYSLRALSRTLTARGTPLVLRRGPPATVIPELARDLEAAAVFWTRGYEPYFTQLEQVLRQALTRVGTDVRRFGGALLFEPEEVQTGSGHAFKVFTPFWKTCQRKPPPAAPLAPPRALRGLDREIASDDLDGWSLLPSHPDWSHGLRESWVPGESGAFALLQHFLEASVSEYASVRDHPQVQGTSRLSPHLSFGEISPRQIWHAVHAARGDAPGEGGAYAFLRQLGWREFAYHLLFHRPELPERPLRAEFDAFPWRDDPHALDAWQQGRTGYPLVDAGMRELWYSGWMHNRVRMVAASFLVKHLMLAWQRGAEWFWDTLVDADLANNSASWQWVAGCGTDAAPYFRIFNPVLQGRKFDPEGSYVRRWVPELAGLTGRYIHEPWAAPSGVMTKAGIVSGETYPHPVIDHRLARERALAAYKRLRARPA